MLMRLFFIGIATLLISACSTLGFLEGGEQNTAESAAATSVEKSEKSAPIISAKPSTNEDLELRIARLSSRIDELETELVQVKERNKLIEKGLLLGLVPDELKSPSASAQSKKSVISEASQSMAAKKLEVKTPEVPKNEGSEDRELYRKMLQGAQNQFNRANYGQAITAYNEIGTKFDDGITEGNHHYWIGLSWFYLKEYKLAEESFQTLQTRYPSSPWVDHAAFYLAKVDLSRGFHQRALEQFQTILDNNPSRDLGEMAQSEIARMKEKL